MPHERANGIAWIGWGLTLPLAYLGPVLRPLTGVRGIGRWPIFAAVGAMLVVLLLIRRDRRALGLSLGMSASALAIGGTGGFVSAALLSDRWLAAALALKWALVGAALIWVFRRELHDRGFTPEQEREVDERYGVHHVAGRYLGVAPEAVEEKLATLTEKEQEEFSRHMTAQWERNMSEINADLARLGRKTNMLLALAAGTMLAGGLMIWLVNRR